MKRYTPYSISLIAGSVASLGLMAFHPTGHDLLNHSAEASLRYEWVALVTHWTALISAPLLFFGLVGLGQFLSMDRPVIILALILSAVGLLSGMLAAVINGLVGPNITHAIQTAEGPLQDQLRTVLLNNTLANAALDRIFVVFTGVSTVLWSIAILRKNKVVGGLGLCSALTSLALLLAHIRMDVHGFGLLIVLYTAWLLSTALLLSLPDLSGMTRTSNNVHG